MKARNMTFCTLAGGSGGTLGIRTERGILEVARASKQFRIKAAWKSGAPAEPPKPTPAAGAKPSASPGRPGTRPGAAQSR